MREGLFFFFFFFFVSKYWILNHCWVTFAVCVLFTAYFVLNFSPSFSIIFQSKDIKSGGGVESTSYIWSKLNISTICQPELVHLSTVIVIASGYCGTSISFLAELWAGLDPWLFYVFSSFHISHMSYACSFLRRGILIYIWYAFLKL